MGRACYSGMRNDRKPEDTKMTIGSILRVEYATGEKFTGEVVQVKTMTGERILFTLKIEGVGYRALYLDKCTVCDYLGCSDPDLAGLAAALAG